MAEVTLQEAAQGALVEKKGNFKPGHPKFGGRQKGAAGLASRDVSASAAKYTARCLRELWALAKATADDKVKAQCLIELLERGPRQGAQPGCHCRPCPGVSQAHATARLGRRGSGAPVGPGIRSIRACTMSPSLPGTG